MIDHDHAKSLMADLRAALQLAELTTKSIVATLHGQVLLHSSENGYNGIPSKQI